MILWLVSNSVINRTCPHTRGDDPVRVTASNFEPKLVPIRVGMIRNNVSIVKLAKTCPHTRGDDPTIR